MPFRKRKIQGLVEVPGGYYDVEFTPADEGGYVARAPALRCTTQGETLEDAQTMIADAVVGWLAVARETGLRIPTPNLRE